LEIIINKDKTFQEIEGFGFFGAKDCWWVSDSPDHYFDDKWLEQTLCDLGITMWRNEIYPTNPPDSRTCIEPQQGYWDRQKGAVVALSKKAKELGIPLKVILSVWSPPGEWKVDCSDIWDKHDSGDLSRTKPHPSTKNGGTLSPLHYVDYGNWLVKALDMYRDVGVTVYALSMQNEAMFPQPYNSCAYTHDWYCELLKNVVPIIKKSYPDVKIFGSENMLAFEAALVHKNFRFHEAIVNDPDALECLDVFAVHGYQDGIKAEAVENHKKYWALNTQRYFSTTGKPQWMTETSGFFENWETTKATPGAMDLAIAMHSALTHGNVSAWVWWQGGEMVIVDFTQYVLTAKGKPGKRYYVSKHFYRYIRPGAKRVEVVSSSKDVLCSAFKHDDDKTLTVVLVNASDDECKVSLSTAGLPQKYDSYRTTECANENCSFIGKVDANDISLPSQSITTLYYNENSED